MGAPLRLKIEQAHAYRLGRISRLLRRHLISVTARVDPDISPEQFVLVMRLAEVSSLPQADLVDPILNDRPNITRQLQGLLKRGLVRAVPDPSDSRRRRLSLTGKGQELFERFVPHVIENRQALFGTIPKGDLAALERVLRHLEKALSL